jgi:hypothetical protein
MSSFFRNVGIKNAFFFSGLLLILFGCKTVAVDEVPPISISQGLTKSEQKLAILLAVNPVEPGETEQALKNHEKITDSALKAIFGKRYKSINQSRENYWFVEDIRENSILVGYDNDKHYLRIEYLLSDGNIYQRIDGSRNLDQNGDQIHKAAKVWMGEMESKIRKSAGQVALLKPHKKTLESSSSLELSDDNGQISGHF